MRTLAAWSGVFLLAACLPSVASSPPQASSANGSGANNRPTTKPTGPQTLPIDPNDITEKDLILKNRTVTDIQSIVNAFPGIQHTTFDSGTDTYYVMVGPKDAVDKAYQIAAKLEGLASKYSPAPMLVLTVVYQPRYVASADLVSFLSGNFDPKDLKATSAAIASVPTVQGSSAYLKAAQTGISLLGTGSPVQEPGPVLPSGIGPQQTAPETSELQPDADTTPATPSGPGTTNQTSTATLVPILLSGTDPAVITKAKDLLAQIDVAPQQVEIEARFIEVSPEILKNIGVTWTDLGGGLATLGIHESTPYPGKILKFGTFSRDPLNFTAAINALISENKAREIADPRTTVLNQQEGTIFIGDQLQYVVGQSTDQQGRLNFSLASQDVGVNLIVKPIVNRAYDSQQDGTAVSAETTQKVTLNLVIGSSTLLTPLVGSTPQVSTRRVNTTAVVDDGAVLAIGGLTRQLVTRQTRKIPLLGDIPLIGQLFRNTLVDNQTTELVMLISPHVVTPNDTLDPPTGIKARDTTQIHPFYDNDHPAPATAGSAH